MKYFFVAETKTNKIFILAAYSLNNAKNIAKKNKIKIETIYELKEDTFNVEGFLC